MTAATVRSLHSTRFCVLLALVLVALFYGPTLGFELVWDDSIWLNEFRRHDLATLLKANLTGNTLASYYRPLVAAVLSLQLAISQQPVFLHALNVALHACNLLLVIAIARRQVTRRPAYLLPLAITVLAIHPILVEPVAWVSGRFDLFYTAFLLLALLAALSSISPPRRFIAVTLAFFAALCCKESALAYLVVGPLILAGTLRQSDKHPEPAVTRLVLWHGAALLLGAALYLGLRIGWLDLRLVKDTAFDVQAVSADGGHGLRVLRTLGTYLQMTLLPLWNLAPLHEITSEPRAVHGYAALGAVACLLALAGLRWRALLPCTVWLLALAPAANLLPLRLDLVQNRYLYFPLFAAAVSALLRPYDHPVTARMRGLWWLLVALGLATLAATNLSITRLWRDGVALFSWTVAVNPGAHFAQENLALAQHAAGHFDKAIEVEMSVPHSARSFQGRLVLARATRDQGDAASAVALYKDALRYPAYDDAMQASAIYELALLWRELGDEAASARLVMAADALVARAKLSARLQQYYHREFERR